MARKTKNNNAAFAVFATIIVIATVVVLWTRSTGQAGTTPAADLYIKDIRYLHTAQPSRLVVVDVCNKGTASTGKVTFTKLTVSSSLKSTPILSPGACTTVQWKRCAETGIPASGGNIKLNARVDNTGLVVESNEANNILAVDKTVSIQGTGGFC